jgi:hypothetical protein
MNTDDADPGNPSRQNEFRDEEQPDNLPPGPGGRHRRLGPDGVPVQDRWAEGRVMHLLAWAEGRMHLLAWAEGRMDLLADRWAEGPMYLLAAGCLIFGGVSGGLAVNNQHRSVALAAVCVLLSLLSGGMACLGLVEIGESKMQGGWVIWLALIVGCALAVLGFGPGMRGG